MKKNIIVTGALFLALYSCGIDAKSFQDSINNGMRFLTQGPTDLGRTEGESMVEAKLPGYSGSPAGILAGFALYGAYKGLGFIGSMFYRGMGSLLSWEKIYLAPWINASDKLIHYTGNKTLKTGNMGTTLSKLLGKYNKMVKEYNKTAVQGDTLLEVLSITKEANNDTPVIAYKRN